MLEEFDPYHSWLGIRPDESRPLDYYRLLGVNRFESDRQVLALNADRQLDHVRKFAGGPQGEQAEKLLNELTQARLTLLKPEKKADYDQRLQQQAQPLTEIKPASTQEMSFTPAPVHVGNNTHLRGKKSSKLPWAILGIAVLCVVALIIVLQNQNPPKDVVQNEPKLKSIKSQVSPEKKLPLEPNKPVQAVPVIDIPKFPPDKKLIVEPPPPAPEADPKPEVELPPERPVEPVPEMPILAVEARLPTPVEADQAKSREVISVLYAKEIAAAKKGAEKLALAIKLLQVANETKNDPTSMYVLLMMARDLAISAGDVTQTLALNHQLTQNYQLDLVTEQQSVLTKLIQNPTAALATQKSIVAVSLTLAQEHESIDQFDLAIQFARIAFEAAQKTRDVKLVKQVTEFGKSLSSQKSLWAGVQAAHQVLDTNPQDPSANMLLGRWYWFSKANPTQGMPYLAKTIDSPLKTAAILDLDDPADGPTQLQIGEQWWTLSQATNDETAKAKLAERALDWYLKAVTSLTGLQKTLAEKRIAEIKPLVEQQAMVNLTTKQPGLSKTVKSSLGAELIYIPAGKFRMGCPEAETGRKSNENQVDVEITKGFYMGRYEVTQGEWESLMGTEPWKSNGKLKEGVRDGARNPVVYVTWINAYEFCKKLSTKEKKEYRLPTEAEWEYACRAGSTTAFSFGEDPAKLSDYAWFVKNSKDVNEKYAHQVGMKKPNPYGLFDMHGNVYEWCNDRYGEQLLGGRDPIGPKTGSSVMCRGGGWDQDSAVCRSATRNKYFPRDNNFLNTGFRLVLVPSSSKAIIQSSQNDLGEGNPSLEANKNTTKDTDTIVREIPNKLNKSKLVGANTGGKFEETQPNAMVVGFTVTTRNALGNGDVIASVQVLYSTPNGQSESPTYGKAGAKPIKVLAKPGYVVGGMVAKGGLRLDGFKIVFMRERNGKLDVNDTYDSAWLGGKGGGKEAVLDGAGEPVIGIYGGSGSEIDGLGLIYAKK